MEENKTPKEQQTANNTDQVCDSEEKKTPPVKKKIGKLPQKTLYMIIGGAAALVILAVVIVILLIPKGDSPNNPLHTHSFGEWETVAEATCGNNGEMKHSCACGEIETKEIPATGAHILTEWAIDKAPTEDSDGIIYGKCENCDERVNEKTIPYVKADMYAYRVNNDGVTCTLDGFKSGKEISDPVIPTNLDGYIVTVIGVNAFCYDKITSVTIPDTVVSLEFGAFNSCEQLQTVNLPDGLVEICDSAFASCDSLKSIVIPASVVTMGSGIFDYCSSLESITFENGSKLQRLSVATLFADTLVESVEIPDTVSFAGGISVSSFDDLSPFTEYDNAYYIGNKDNPYHILLSAKSGDITSCTIHEDTKVIADSAFSFCRNLTSISFPGDCELRSIGWQAFMNCGNLTQIYIGGGVEYIGERAFMFCSKLGNAYIGRRTKSISNEAFAHCSELNSIEIPAGVTELGNSAFLYCRSLESVTFAEGSLLESIGESAFEECKNLKEIIIPKNVSYIGKCAFRYCTYIKSITLPEKITAIYENTFSSCANLRSIDIPEGVISIGNYCFTGCYELENVYLPTSLTELGYTVFDGPDTVYYAGSEEEWNTLLANALSSPAFYNTIIHFNYNK